MIYDGWREISEFPEYAVSEAGRVKNLRTDRILTMRKNNNDVVRVGLIRDGIQYNRSVTLLVANAFLNPHPIFNFLTPICLDGDRSNNYYTNLRWRSRSFAIRYQNQFKPNAKLDPYPFPIEDVDTGDEYETSWPAAITYGLLDLHVRIGVMNRSHVWPEDKLFRKIKRRFDYNGDVIPHLIKKRY